MRQFTDTEKDFMQICKRLEQEYNHKDVITLCDIIERCYNESCEETDSKHFRNQLNKAGKKRIEMVKTMLRKELFSDLKKSNFLDEEVKELKIDIYDWFIEYDGVKYLINDSKQVFRFGPHLTDQMIADSIDDFKILKSFEYFLLDDGTLDKDTLGHYIYRNMKIISWDSIMSFFHYYKMTLFIDGYKMGEDSSGKSCTNLPKASDRRWEDILFTGRVDMNKIEEIVRRMLQEPGSLGEKPRLYVMYRCLEEKRIIYGNAKLWLEWANDTFGLMEIPNFKGHYSKLALIPPSKWDNSLFSRLTTATQYIAYAKQFFNAIKQ